MKKIFYITAFIGLLLIGFLGITYSYEYNENEPLKFELIGPYELYLNVNTEYEEYGIKVYRNNTDISSLVNIDSSLINVNKLGEYKVKYEVDVDGNKEYVYRIVKVIDNIKPEIKLVGEDTIYVNLGGNYNEQGCFVFDNYDKNLYNNLVITNNINISKAGEYEVVYMASDNSGNESEVVRKVIVK